MKISQKQKVLKLMTYIKVANFVLAALLLQIQTFIWQAIVKRNSKARIGTFPQIPYEEKK